MIKSNISIILLVLLNIVINNKSYSQTPYTIGSSTFKSESAPYCNRSSEVTLGAYLFKGSGKNTPLLPASMANKPIISIGWNLVTAPVNVTTGTLKIYLKHNTAAVLPIGELNYEYEKSGATLFFSGIVTLPSTEGWWQIAGNQGSTFSWDGSSINNLEVLTEFTRSANVPQEKIVWEGTPVAGSSGATNNLFVWTTATMSYGGIQYNPWLSSGSSIRPNMQFLVAEGCTVPLAPVATTPQTFCQSGKVSELSATGENIRWYFSEEGGVALTAETALTEGAKYYVSQTVGSCESTDRTQVLVIDRCNTKVLVSGKVYYNNSIMSPMTNTKVYLKNTDGIALDSVLTDKQGYYLFKEVKYGSYKLTCKTLKQWGGVTPIDALYINRFFIKLYKFTDKLKELAGDVNKDNSLTPIDALMINKRFIKTLSSFNSGDWLFEDISFNVTDSDITLDIKAICYGDVDATYQPK